MELNSSEWLAIMVIASLFIISITILAVRGYLKGLKNEKSLTDIFDTYDLSMKITNDKLDVANEGIGNAEDELTKIKEIIHTPVPTVQYEVITQVIKDRIDDIWENKYLLYFAIRELKVIPNLDKEIESFTTEVMESFSEYLLEQIKFYYSQEYLVKFITRQAQILMVNYIDTHKPTVK